MQQLDDPVPAAEPLLDADLLRQLERLRFSTLTAIVAGLVGERQGQARVAHLEFSDYRPYVAGDELRRIDWNIYRRLHQLVVKVGIEDGRLSLAVLVDVSRSMRTGSPSKLRAAQRLAAALSRQIATLAHELEHLPESLETGLEAALTDHARARSQSDVALLISDANVPLDELGRALRALAAGARTSVLLHVVAPDELETPLRGPLELRDAETGRALETTLGEQAVAEYAERFARFSESVHGLCREWGVNYLQARSDADPLDVLLAHASDAALSLA
jgi:uncharacterized protein (DUF58 family)